MIRHVINDHQVMAAGWRVDAAASCKQSVLKLKQETKFSPFSTLHKDLSLQEAELSLQVGFVKRAESQDGIFLKDTVRTQSLSRQDSTIFPVVT